MGKTLAQIISDARAASNTQKSKFVTDDEIGNLVNRAVHVLYDLITTADASYYNSTIDITFGNLTEAAATMPLPPDFSKVRGVTRFPDTLQASPVYAKTFTNHQIGTLGYYMDGNNISIGPFQLASPGGPFRLTYVQKAPQFGPAINVQTNLDTVSGTGPFLWTLANLPALNSYLSAYSLTGATLNVSGCSNFGNNGTFNITGNGVNTITTTGGSNTAETFGPTVAISIQFAAVTPTYPVVSPYQAASMITLDTTLDNFDDFVSLWTAVRICEKKKDTESVSNLNGLLQAATERVNAMAPDRSAEPEQAPVLWSPSQYPFRGIFPYSPGTGWGD